MRPLKSRKKAPEKPPDPQQISTLSDYFSETVSTFPTYADRLLKVQTKDGRLIEFGLNEVQLLLEDIIKDIKKKRRLVRMIILKARRFGISTWVSGRYYWKTVSNKNRYSMIICHEPEATDFVFHMHKRFQMNMPDYFKAEERYNNKKMLEFNNDNGTGLDSAIRVGTAGKEDFGSAQLIHYLHLSEMAKYPRHTTSNLLTAILQCVPDTVDSEVIFESTAKGVGGEFYDRFWASRYRYDFYLDRGAVRYREIVNESAPESNDYTSIFIPWYVFSEYSKKFETPIVLTEAEQKLKDTYGLTDEQIYWRRWTIENKCNGDEKVFNQEYPATAEEAFISSTDSIFPIEEIRERLDKIQPPKARYNCNLTIGNFMADKEGKLLVWKEPMAGREYILSGDVAEGLRKGDASCFDVIDMASGEQVAHWHGRIPPDQFGIWANWTGRRYNNCIVAIERNMHGLTAIDKLQNMGYNKIYFELVPDPPARHRKRMGWVTTKTSKPLMIDNLAAEFREKIDGINCRETLEEMMVFKQYEDGSMEAEEGRHDDRVISIAIGKLVRTNMPRFKKAYKAVLNKVSTAYQRKVITNPRNITPASWA